MISSDDCSGCACDRAEQDWAFINRPDVDAELAILKNDLGDALSKNAARFCIGHADATLVFVDSLGKTCVTDSRPNAFVGRLFAVCEANADVPQIVLNALVDEDHGSDAQRRK